MNLARIWSERKKIILLVLLLFLLVVLLARQADLVPPGPVGRVVRTVVHPVVAAVAAMDRLVARAWVVVFRGERLEAENRELKREIAELRLKCRRLEEARAQLERLSKLTAAVPAFDLPTVTANIIGISPNFWTRTVTIDRGRRDGLKPDMPVINQDGLVGIVRDAAERSALVQLLVDPEFAAGALVRETRDRGIVEGTGELDRLRMILENPQTPLESGYEVITSGLPAGSLFPKGFLIGKIASIERNKFGQPYAIVRPAVRFDRLEEVVVLLETPRNELLPQQVPVPPP